MSNSTPTAFSIWFSALRPRTLPAAVAPVLVGTAFAAHEGKFVWLAALACLGFALLIQIGTNFANDYYDFIKGADTAERVGPRRAVASGLVTPATMKRVMIAVFAAAFLVGLSLLPYGGWPLLVIGVTSILCGVAYTGGPYPLGYNGLGDLFVFIFFGLIAVCATYFVQAGAVTLPVVLASAAIGALAANILVLNNYRDVETDAKAGKRTLVVRWGKGFAQAQFAASLVLAFAVPVALKLGGAGWWVLLPLALVPMGAGQFIRMKKSTTAPELIVLLGESGKLLALYAVVLSVGVWVG